MISTPGDPEPDVHAEPAALDPTAPHLPPPPPSSKARRWLGVLAPVADYVRRYLGVYTRNSLGDLAEAVEGLNRDLGELREISRHQAQLLAAALGKLDQLSTGQQSMGGGLGDLLRADAALGQQLATLRGEVGSIPALFGPRFDELEIKCRPLVPYDEASYAIRLRDGYLLTPRAESALTAMVANATSEGLEPGTRRVLQALIEPGMGIVDVGANIGLHTLATAVRTGPGGVVFAFEPEPGPRDQLRKMVHLNGLSWVRLKSEAVGRRTEQRQFHVSPIIGHSSLYELPPVESDAAQIITVEVVRLDEALPADQRIDVVKIDVEGAELDVLAGMATVIARNEDIAIVAEFGPSHLARVGLSPDVWFSAFAELGFIPFVIAEPSGACAPVTPQVLEHESTNLVFVRPQGRAMSRLPR